MSTNFLKKVLSVKVLVCLLTTLVGTVVVMPATSLAATATSVSPTSVAKSASTNVTVTFTPDGQLLADYPNPSASFTLSLTGFNITGINSVSDSSADFATAGELLDTTPTCAANGDPQLQYDPADLTDGNGSVQLWLCESDMIPLGATIGSGEEVTIGLAVTTPSTAGSKAVDVSAGGAEFTTGSTTIAVTNPTSDRYVDDGGADSGDCSNSASPCATLDYAFGQANHGETIYVDAGTYSDAVAFDKAVNIAGWNTGDNSNVLISGVSAISIPSGTGVTGVTYSNVQFNNAAAIAISDQTGMSGGVTLSNVVLDFANGSTVGCFNVGSAPNSFSKFTLTGSTVKDCGAATSNYIFKDNGVASFNTFIATDNTIGTASTTAIEPITLTSALTTLTFTGNDFNTAYTSGSSILSATGGVSGTFTLTGNVLNPATYNGLEPVINVSSVTDVADITGNSMNTTRLVVTFADSNTFTVSGNTFESLSLKETTGSPSSSSVTVTQNKIVGATTNTLLDVEAATVTATSNVINSTTGSSSLPATVKVSKGSHTYFNNTMVTNSGSPLIHITSDNTHTLKNNALRAPATIVGTAAILKCESITGGNVTLDYNNFRATTNYNLAAASVSEGGSDPYITNTTMVSGTCARGANTVSGDPDYETTSTEATTSAVSTDSLTMSTSGYTSNALAGQFAYLRYGDITKYFYIISNTTNQLKLQTETDLSGIGTGDTVNTTKYSPAETSPLVDAGTSTGAPSTDVDGTTRSGLGDAYDIGAYESAYTANTAPTISGVLVDGVAVASQTNAGLYPQISWTFADVDSDTQSTYRVYIAAAGGGGGGGRGGATPINVFDSGTVSSTDTTVESSTFSTASGLTAGTAYTLTITVSDGNATASSSTTFTAGTPGITLSSDAVSATEGSTGTFTLVLDTRPADTVTITFTTANSEVTIDPSPVTFTRDNWDTVQTVTVTATDDSDVEGEHTDTITMDVSGSAASDYSGVTEPGPITVTITDNDSAPAPASSGGGGGSISSILNQTNTTSPSTTDENTENDTTETTDETTEDTEDITEPDPAINPTNLDSSGATGDFSQEIGITTVSPSINDRIQEITRPGDLGTGEFTNSPAISTTTEDSIRFQQLISSLDTTEDGEVDTNEVQTGNDFEILSKAFVSYLKEDTNRSPGVFSEYQDDDNDGIQNSIEKLLGTDPKKADSDGDGVDDGQEINFYGTSPKVANVNISKLINVNLPKSLTPRTQLPVAAPEGSQVTVYYLNRAGEKVFLTNGTTGRNNIVLLDIEDLPVDEEIRLVTEVITPDRQTREITSEKFRVKLSRLTADTAIVYIDGNRVRDFNRTYIVKNRDAVIEGQIPTPAARWNIASLVFGSMILTDSSAGQVAAKIPQEILEDPGVHQASLLAFDPETEEYSEPVSISFIYQPNRLLPDLAKGQLSIFDPGMAFLILLTLGALAIAAAGGLKYHQHREMKAAQVQTQTKDRS